MSLFKKLVRGLGGQLATLRLEADLYPPGVDVGREMRHGEFEISLFEGGNSKFEIEVRRRAELPQGEGLELRINGEYFHVFHVGENGIDETVQRSAEETWQLEAGATVTVERSGETLLTGTLETKYAAGG